MVAFNCTGNPYYDSLWIEFNAILNSDTDQCSINKLIKLLPDHWEELSMPGLDTQSFPGANIDELQLDYKVSIEEEEPAPYVDLDLIRGKNFDYLSFLNQNTRYQIRKSYRELSKYGDLCLGVANDLETARLYFEELVVLHQKTWQSRNEPGDFASDFFLKFHRNLISNRFENGEIQLSKLISGDKTIGVLYNFSYSGKIYFYQCGINYEFNNNIKPGFLCHVESILYNAKVGWKYYEFLGGDSRYKMSLSTGQRRLVWVQLRKK